VTGTLRPVCLGCDATITSEWRDGAWRTDHLCVIAYPHCFCCGRRSDGEACWHCVETKCKCIRRAPGLPSR
jgi:hypothetical protein